jgi:CRP-like cAMP-binding protein
LAQKCENCLLRQRQMFQDMSREEIQFMQKFKVGELVVEAGTPILMEGSNSPQLFTAFEGMGVRYKTLPNGRRQVVSFVFPGDFVGMQAGIMGEMGHAVEATTKMTLCVFDRSGVWNLFKNHPERAFDLTWIAASEENFLGEALSSVGQRSAIEAIAWALVRIFLRGAGLGLVKNNVMPLPFRQQDLADALGLSLVHTNKTLASLRERQLANWSEGELRISDLEALAALAQTDTAKVTPRPIL